MRLFGRVWGEHPAEAPFPHWSDLPELPRYQAERVTDRLWRLVDCGWADVYRRPVSRGWNVWLGARIRPETKGQRLTLEEFAAEVLAGAEFTPE